MMEGCPALGSDACPTDDRQALNLSRTKGKAKRYNLNKPRGRRISVRPREVHNLPFGSRRQHLLRRDEFAECRVVPTPFRSQISTPRSSRRVTPAARNDARRTESEIDRFRSQGRFLGPALASCLPDPDTEGRPTVESWCQGSAPLRRVDGSLAAARLNCHDWGFRFHCPESRGIVLVDSRRRPSGRGSAGNHGSARTVYAKGFAPVDVISLG
jgi:hypothetical protein